MFKALVCMQMWVYFPFKKYKHLERLRFKGPGIIVSNHPNTMTDPLLVAGRSPRQNFFLANAGMFKHPVAGFVFSHLYCIPIARPGRDDGAKKISNRDSFLKSYEHLIKGGVLFIAPEGTSFSERRLRPLKTGTARIALGAEAEVGFTLGLHIYPNGITYENPSQCGSRVYLEAGRPIRVADWQAAYEADPVQASRDLTDHLEQRMQSLIIHTDDDAQDRLLYRLQLIWQHDDPLSVEAHYTRGQRLLTKLQAAPAAAYEAIAAKASSYREQLRANGLTDRGISKAESSLLSLPAVLGWPVWLYGRINNLLAYEIPRWLVGKLDMYVGYASTVKILSGTVTFPLFYYLQYKWVQCFVGGIWPLIYLLSLPISGILAWAYARHVVPRWEARKWRAWRAENEQAAAELVALRTDLADYVKSA